jgi:hypothetical protein
MQYNKRGTANFQMLIQSIAGNMKDGNHAAGGGEGAQGKKLFIVVLQLLQKQ